MKENFWNYCTCKNSYSIKNLSQEFFRGFIFIYLECFRVMHELIEILQGVHNSVEFLRVYFDFIKFSRVFFSILWNSLRFTLKFMDSPGGIL